MIGQKDVQRVEAQRVHRVMETGLVPDRSGVAIDGGAHVGSWAVLMAEYFKKVHAFEPCKESFDMLKENTVTLLQSGGLATACHMQLHNKALMDQCCRVDVVQPRPKRKTLTARQVRKEAAGTVEAVTIDSLNLEGCDLIKLDLEGAEALALKGATQTLQEYKPFLVIEFNNLCPARDILNIILPLGYTEVWRDGVDRGFTCAQ